MDSLALVTETLKESPFLDDIRRHAALDPLLWEALPPVPSLDGARLEIRVFNAYGVKDQLTDLKYHWDSVGKYWHRAILEEGFSFDALLAQSWVRHGIKVEVYDETGKLLNRL